jgi:hypothetical protein
LVLPDLAPSPQPNGGRENTRLEKRWQGAVRQTANWRRFGLPHSKNLNP